MELEGFDNKLPNRKTIMKIGGFVPVIPGAIFYVSIILVASC